MRQRKKKRGFTLVELLIVIAISGVLMAMSAPKYTGIVGKADEMEQRAHVREALNYIDIYNLEPDRNIADTVLLKNLSLDLDIDDEKDEFGEVKSKIDDYYQEKSIGDLRLFAEGRAGSGKSTVTITE